MEFARGARTGRRTILTPSLRKTSSNAVVNLESRSPEKELGRESTVLEFPGQIAGLLHHPLGARVVSAAGEVNATAADLNKEEDVELGHPDGVDHKEVTGEHLVGVLAYEGSPGALSAPRRWAEAMAAEDPDHGQVRAPHAELKQLTYRPARAGDQPVRVRSGQAARGAR